MRSRLVVAAVAMLAMVGSVRAEDSVQLKGGFKHFGTVHGLRDGKLWMTIESGPRVFEWEEVQTVTLESAPRFGEAEAARTTDVKKAAAFYKEAIRALNDPPMKLLAQYRAIAPADGDGKWTEAVAYFLEVYAAMPTESVWKSRPTRLPPAESSMLKESNERIQAALKNFKSDEARKNLKNLQLDILTRAGETEAAQRLAREIATGVVEETALPATPRAVDPAAQASAAVAAVEEAIRTRDFASALKQADALLGNSTGEQAVQVFLLKARVLEEQNQLDLATAALLRVVAHYPSSPAAPGALLRAAELQKRANHPEAAKALLAEIMTQYPESREAAVAKNP
jgi:tetratricopeptide (TPR) repeat protein